LKQNKSPEKSSGVKKSRPEELHETNWLKRTSIYIFFAGIGTIGAGINTAGVSEEIGRGIILAGLGVTVTGLVIWSSINILLKGSRNVES
jgi:hypothetical protein